MPHKILNTIEMAHLRQFNAFLHSYSPIKSKKEQLTSKLNEMGHILRDLQHEFDKYDEETTEYITVLKELQHKYDRTQMEMNEVQRFLSECQLTQDEVYVLSQGPVSMQKDMPFFEVLKKVHDIRERATRIVTKGVVPGGVQGGILSGDGGDVSAPSTQPPRAWIEVMEEMSMYQDSAYTRLSEWIQDKCRAFLGEEESDNEANLLLIESELNNAIKVLGERPVLLQCCISEIVNARKQSIVQKFISALTGRWRDGGMKAGALEMQAYDSVNYVGDVLAWIHQNIASERELIFSLLDVDAGVARGDSNNTPSDLSTQTPQNHSQLLLDAAYKMLDDISSKLCKQLEQRLEQQVFNPEANLDVQNYFRIAHLCELYSSTIGKLLGEQAALPKLLLRLKATAMEYFFESLDKDAQVLMREGAIQIPNNFAPPAALVESLQRLTDIMNTYSQTVVPESRREEDFSSVLNKVLNPLIDAIQKSATKVNGTPVGQCVFLINCYHAIQSELSHYKFTTRRVESIEADMNQKVEQLLNKQTNQMIESFGFRNKMLALARLQEQDSNDTPQQLSDLISREEMQDFLQAFYQKLFSMGPDGVLDASLLRKISNVKLRNYAISRLVKELSLSYEKIYNAIVSESSGYTNSKELAYHNPQQVNVLLQST